MGIGFAFNGLLPVFAKFRIMLRYRRRVSEKKIKN
jgi:hypothetical protein